ncbi:MAG: S8 family serine peptidase [Anaerolineaceae bacterium]|nr:S8 family serine peptidase [Anaerolineaceae bacterium]
MTNLTHDKKVLKVVLALLLVLIASTVALAQDGGTVDRPDPGSLDRTAVDLANLAAGDPDRIVEVFAYLETPSVAEFVGEAIAQGQSRPDRAAQQARAAQIENEQQALRDELSRVGAVELSSLQVGANGFRVLVRAGDIAQLRALPGVVKVAPVTYHYPVNESSVPWVGAPEVWDTYGATGEGISIAVIDTGIDYTHANFGGPGTVEAYDNNDPEVIEAGTFPTAKVIGGFDFAGPIYNPCADPPIEPADPDPDPLDGNGHGSHVAGTAAGLGVTVNSEVEIGPGMAPDASLYALKVFNDTSGCTNLTSDAIEWALDPNGDGSTDDHVDVINMSLGSDFGSPEDPSAVSSQNAVEMGVVVVAAAGNAGPAHYVVGSPSVAPDAISVAASYDGGFTVLGIEVVSPASIANVYEAAESAIGVSLDDIDPITEELVIAEPLDACTPLANAAEIAGNIALVQRGTCTFAQKHLNVQAAGGVAILVYNNVDGPPINMGGDPTGIQIPGVMISLEDGNLLKDTIESGQEVVVTISADIIVDKPEVADTIADFSSAGPGRGGSTFKPDITAPGVGIQSTLVGTGFEGGLNNGTSMATPHVAGAAALLVQLHPDYSPLEIKALLQNSTVTANSGGPGTDTPYALSRQGTGVLRVDQAAALESLVMPGGVSFGRVNPFRTVTVQTRVAIQNMSDEMRTYAVSHVPNQTFPGVTVTNLGSSSIQVPPHGRAVVRLELTMDPSVGPFDDAFFSQTEVDGWFIFDDGSDSLRVGYLAVVDPASNVNARAVGCRSEGGCSVQLGNQGPSLGWVEGFTYSNGEGLILDDEPNAIEAFGYRTNTLSGIDVVQFGLAVEAPWESMSAYEVDVFLDTNEDGTDDYALAAVDLGLLQGQDPTGQVVTALFNLSTGSGVIEWFVSGDYNDRTAVLTVDRHGEFGFLEPGDTTFDYTLVTFDLTDETFDVATGSVDLADEIVPDMNSFGLEPRMRTNVPVDTSGGPGMMLWLFQNNPPHTQVDVVDVE